MSFVKTRVFGLSAVDLQKRLQPMNQDQGFLVSDDGDLSIDDAGSILQACEDTALELMAEPLRKLSSRCAERLIDRAVGGEKTFRTTLTPVVTESVKVYLNYPVERVWTMRDQSLALQGGWSINESGVLTLNTPLASWDRLWVEYEHHAAQSWEGVKCDVLDLAACEVAKRYEMFRDAERGLQDVQKFAETARYNLKDRKWIAGLGEPRLVTDRIGDSRRFDILLTLGSM